MRSKKVVSMKKWSPVWGTILCMGMGMGQRITVLRPLTM